MKLGNFIVDHVILRSTYLFYKLLMGIMVVRS